MNDDGIAEPDEVKIVPGIVHSVTVSPHLELVTDTAMSYQPSSFTRGGAPVFHLTKAKYCAPRHNDQRQLEAVKCWQLGIIGRY